MTSKFASHVAIMFAACAFSATAFSAPAGQTPFSSNIDFENTPMQGPVKTITGEGFKIKARQQLDVHILNGSSPGKSITGNHLYLPYDPAHQGEVLFYLDEPAAYVTINFAKEKAGSGFEKVVCYGEDGGKFAYMGRALEGTTSCHGREIYAIAIAPSEMTGWMAIDNVTSE